MPVTRAALLAAVLTLAACAGPIGAPPPVPPPQPETVPLRPASGEDLIWRPGHWNWDGRGYAWVPGEYERFTGQRVFQQGHWRQDSTGWTWVPARWL
jgi:hypothetical protein